MRRSLPVIRRRSLGPFVFFDHMGPATAPPGGGGDVGPHPHIGLATVTYLFAGESVHRDSLGSEQVIRPGDVNWMIAGRGIVHSERATEAGRARGGPMHGLQLWSALPVAHEEDDPSFHHAPVDALPMREEDGVRLRVLLGEAFGMASPVPVLSPTLYLDVQLEAGAELELPAATELGVYALEGAVRLGVHEQAEPALMILEPGQRAVIEAIAASRVIVLGGEPLDGPRFIEWNFVSSDKARLARAKDDWRAGRFDPIPNDDGPPIPLPEMLR